MLEVVMGRSDICSSTRAYLRHVLHILFPHFGEKNVAEQRYGTLQQHNTYAVV